MSTISPPKGAPRLSWNRPEFNKKYYADQGATLFATEEEQLVKPNYDTYNQALKIMRREHSNSSYKISSLAEELSLSVRQLQRIFKNSGSPGFRIEMRKIRVSEGQALLRNTNMSIADIAAKSGYAHATHFSQSFQTEISCTPREYRDSARQRLGD